MGVQWAGVIGGRSGYGVGKRWIGVGIGRQGSGRGVSPSAPLEICPQRVYNLLFMNR